VIGDDAFTRYYAPLPDDMYDVVDRISLNARYNFACGPGGFGQWWFDRYGTFDGLNDTFLMRRAGRFSRRARGWARKHNVPFVDCPAGIRDDNSTGHRSAGAGSAVSPCARGYQAPAGNVNVSRWMR